MSKLVAGNESPTESMSRRTNRRIILRTNQRANHARIDSTRERTSGSVYVGGSATESQRPVAIFPRNIRILWRIMIFRESVRFRDHPARPYMSGSATEARSSYDVFPENTQILARRRRRLDALGFRCVRICRGPGYGNPKISPCISRKYSDFRRIRLLPVTVGVRVLPMASGVSVCAGRAGYADAKSKRCIAR